MLSDEELGASTVLRVSVPDLVVRRRMGITSSAVNCSEHTFVHPVTGLAYFACDTGNHTAGLGIVDTLKQAEVQGLEPGSAMGSDFAYDPTRRWLYVSAGAVILDPENHVVGSLHGKNLSEMAKAAGLGCLTIWDGAVLPDGNVVMRAEYGHSPALFVYDPAGQKILRSWKETEGLKEMRTLNQGGKSREESVLRPFRLGHGPVPSRDGSRLFAISEDDMILWASGTLEEIDRLEPPEPPGRVKEDKCFFAAPDGRGMWFVGESGKVYRLDDQTGKLIEEVKLPFRLINLIREP